MNGTSAPTELLTVTEVARITGLRPSVIRRWARDGVLASRQDQHGRHQFPLESLLVLARQGSDGETLHRRLRVLRIQRGLSQAELAALFGTSQRMVAFWERGTQLDQKGRPLGRAISARFVPLVTQWIAAGRVPDMEQRPLRATDRQWQRGLAALAAFSQREGHCDVPSSHVENGMALGRWVRRQRRLHGRGVLGAEREASLGRFAGWTWTTTADGFEYAIHRLQAFVAREMSARVPAWYRTLDGFPLGRWCRRQRAEYRHGRLAPDRIRALERIAGWTWAPRGRRRRGEASALPGTGSANEVG